MIFAISVAKINNGTTYKDNNNMKFKVVVPRKKGKDNMAVQISISEKSTRIHSY